MDIVDQPRAGYYMIKIGGKYVAACISEFINPITGEVSDTVFDARVNGQRTDPIFIWHGKGRKEISREAYESMLAAPAPPRPGENVRSNAEESLSIASKWVDISIQSDMAAARCRDLTAYLGELVKRADAQRDKEKRPHIEAGRDIDAQWKPLIGSLQDAQRMLKAKLGEWMRAQETERRRVAQAAAEAQFDATATLDCDIVKEMTSAVATIEPVRVYGNAPGRAASLKTVRKATLSDWNAVHEDIQKLSEVVVVLEKAANAFLRLGAQEVPGFTISEEKVVSL